MAVTLPFTGSHHQTAPATFRRVAQRDVIGHRLYFQDRMPKREVWSRDRGMAWLLNKLSSMESQPGEDLTRRTFQFACDAYDYCEELVQLPGLARRIGWQLFDAAGSIGANREEAKAAYSRRDFIAKNGIVLKECREANFWLRLAEAKSLGGRGKAHSTAA